MMARRIALLGVWCATVACSGEKLGPEPLYAVWPVELQLAPVAWQDDATLFRWESISVLNQTYFTIELFNVAIGDVDAETEVEPDTDATETDAPEEVPSTASPGANFLELRSMSSITEIPIRESRTMEVRFAPPLNEDRTRWATGEYTAELTFTIAGIGLVDATTLEVDRRTRTLVDEVVPITFSINCDLDGDGYDAPACSGRDCNDSLKAVSPDATEVCDGADNNCAGGIDEGCE